MQYTYRDAYELVELTDFDGHHQSLDYAKVFVKKPSQTSFVEITETSEIAYIEDDFYNVKIPAINLDTFGTFLVKIQTFEDTLKTIPFETAYIHVDVSESPVSDALPPDTCLLIGNVQDVAGRPPNWQSTEISYKPYTLPQVHQSAAITSEYVRTVTDLSGHFEMPVIRGTTIVFEIPRCGVRFQYDVPYDLDVINMIDVFNALINS